MSYAAQYMDQYRKAASDYNERQRKKKKEKEEADAAELARVNAQLDNLYPTVFDQNAGVSASQYAAAAQPYVLPENYVNPSDKARQRGWTNTTPQVTTPTTTDTANPVPTVPTEQQTEDDMLRLQKEAADRQARASYERVMKYLPQLQKEQGLYGLGVSETGRIQAANNLYGTLAANDLYYENAQQEKNAERSSNYLQMASAALQNATTKEDAKRIYETYSKYLTNDDATMLGLYIDENYSPAAIETAKAQQAAAEVSTGGGYTFKHNWAGGEGKWDVGGKFVIENASGKNINATIEEYVNDPTLNAVADNMGDEQIFFYGDNLYMVKDQDGKRRIMKLGLSETQRSKMLNAYRENA